MTHYGSGADSDTQYKEMMDLQSYNPDTDVLPAYKALANNYELYQLLVDYYWQDYVCFGYKPDWLAFRHKVNHKQIGIIAHDLSDVYSLWNIKHDKQFRISD